MEKKVLESKSKRQIVNELKYKEMMVFVGIGNLIDEDILSFLFFKLNKGLLRCILIVVDKLLLLRGYRLLVNFKKQIF